MNHGARLGVERPGDNPTGIHTAKHTSEVYLLEMATGEKWQGGRMHWGGSEEQKR